MEVIEVKQSKNNENIEHIEPAELKDKKQVYSQAHFVRIKTGENESKLSLKIGRYKKTEWYETYLKTGVLEVKEPKSELTLDNEELDKLVNYINHHYYPLSNKLNKFNNSWWKNILTGKLNFIILPLENTYFFE